MANDIQPSFITHDYRLVRSVASDVFACVRAVLSWEVIFKMLSAALLLPAFAWASGQIVSLSGQAAVSNEDMVAFVLSPLGLTALAVIGTGGLFVFIIELAGLISLAGARFGGNRIMGLAALRHVAGRSRQLFRLAAIQVGLFALLAAPVIAVGGLCYALLLAGVDINSHLTQRSSEFKLTVAIVGAAALVVGLIGVTIYLRWAFAIPHCVLRNASAVDALRTSARDVRSVFWRLARAFVLWVAMVAIIGGAGTLLSNALESLVFGLAGERLHLIVFGVGVFLALRFAGGLLISVLSAVIIAFVVTRLFEETTNPAGERRDVVGASDDASTASLLNWLTRRQIILASIILLLVGGAIASFALVRDVGVEKRVQVTAHRGSSIAAPENTLSAIRLAIDQGCDFAEIDVQETADGTVVVFHDSDFTRVAGNPAKIWELTDEALAQIDVGGGHSAEFEGERVPTLEEVIRVSKDRIKLNIELKYNGHEQQLVRSVVEIIEREEFVDQCVISSLKTELLPKVRALNDDIAVGAIIATTIGDMNKLDVDFFSLSSERARRSRIRALQKRGKPVLVWTVNDPAMMSRFIEFGVDNILTDDPPTLMAMLDARSELGDAERMLLKFRYWLAN